MSIPAVRIGAVEVPVADLCRAVAWYRECLGLSCAWSDERHALLEGGTSTQPGAAPAGGLPSEAPMHILLVATEEPLRLAFRSSFSGVRHSVLDFRTDELEALHAHLRSRGADVEDLGPPANDWAPRGFAFSDSEGNRLAAFTYRR